MDLFKSQIKNPTQIYSNAAVDDVMSVVDWIVTFLILSIPIVNIVALLIWANGTGNRNKVNFAKAALILVAIGFVFILCSVVFNFNI